MNNIMSFLKLIRIQNLIIILITQTIIKIFLVNPFVNNYSLTLIDYALYLIATLSIISAGYIINDIYDIDTDKVNKKSKIIIGEKISVKNAKISYIVLNIIGVITAAFLAFKLKKIILFVIFIYFIISLWRYSKKLKKTFLIGNIQVAFLTALSIINIILFDIPNNQSNNNLIIIKIILTYALFAFLTTLIREIIKDMEDTKGDAIINANTVVLKLGVYKTKMITIILTIITILLIAYFQYFQYSIENSTFQKEISIWGINKISMVYCLIIQLLLLTLIIKTYISKEKIEFNSASRLCKIIMIVGILAIPLFTILYLN